MRALTSHVYGDFYFLVGIPDGSTSLAAAAAVTALGTSADHLWVGTKGGHVVCAPFQQQPQQQEVQQQQSQRTEAQDQRRDSEPACSTPIRKASADPLSGGMSMEASNVVVGKDVDLPFPLFCRSIRRYADAAAKADRSD